MFHLAKRPQGLIGLISAYVQPEAKSPVFDDQQPAALVARHTTPAYMPGCHQVKQPPHGVVGIFRRLCYQGLDERHNSGGDHRSGGNDADIQARNWEARRPGVPSGMRPFGLLLGLLAASVALQERDEMLVVEDGGGA